MGRRTSWTLLLLAAAAWHGAAAASDLDAAWQAYLEVAGGADTAVVIGAARHVLDVARRDLPEDDERLPPLLANVGMALLAAGRNAAAADYFADALDRARQIHGDKSAQTIPYLEHLGDAAADRGAPRRQIVWYKRALHLAADHYGKHSLEVAELNLRAGTNILTRSAADDGKRYLLKALELFDELPDVDPAQPAHAAFWLGKTNAAQKRYEKAAERFEQALAGYLRSNASPIEYELVTRAQLVHVYELGGLSGEATRHCLAIGARREGRKEADFLPVFRMPPEYPGHLLRRGEEGAVEFEYTVDASGFVRDPVVVGRDGAEGFERAALDAVRRFRYAPRFVNGEAVAVGNVATTITFSID